jgi:hypothetical protein
MSPAVRPSTAAATQRLRLLIDWRARTAALRPDGARA